MEKLLSVAFVLSTLLISCNGGKSEVQKVVSEKVAVEVPKFNADSAFQYIQNQANFGPRVPNTVEHDDCAVYLQNELTRFGAEVTVQNANLRAFDGTILKSKNIIGSFNVEAKSRVLLMSHWDSRPYSDHDADEANYNKPILGVDDGASGVGVLLEMARLFGQQNPTVGVDIVFFDSEDYGNPRGGDSDSWCLGSQYWSANPHTINYRAKYGILLDMVGAKDATFHKEVYSMMYAKGVVEKIWQKAAELGYSNYFIPQMLGQITDDHVPVNEILGVPSVDIINFSENGFPSHWHTQNDDMQNIEKKTLQAVGETLLNVVYEEK